MLVLAAPGLKVPMENNPRNYITDTPPDGERGYALVESPYYLRRVAEGDLVEVADKKAKE
ncbi:hypothetical protein ABWL39_20555 [Chitinivorax sp. PXF-14]|uniref:hypothetical protein n=1 Tax=Chitinivorax sp. PXF-14 TaxID=3230488 RepID=UPI003467DE6D